MADQSGMLLSNDYVHTTDDVLAGSLSVILSMLGIVLNAGILVGVRKFVQKSLFLQLTANQAISNLTYLLLHFFVNLFLVAIDIRKILNYITLLGFLMSICKFCSLLTHILISANRLLAISFPMWYRKNADKFYIPIFLNLVCWLVAFGVTVYFAFIRHCEFGFFRYGWFIMALSSPESCSILLQFVIYFSQSYTVFIIVGIDLCSIILIFKYWDYKNKQSSRVSQIRKSEIMFTYQVIGQGLLLFGEFCVYSYMANLILKLDSDLISYWYCYLFSTFSIIIALGLDALIVLIANSQFRNWLFNPIRKRFSMKTEQMVVVRLGNTN